MIALLPTQSVFAHMSVAVTHPARQLREIRSGESYGALARNERTQSAGRVIEFAFSAKFRASLPVWRRKM